MSNVQRIGSGGPWEAKYGYSRLVVAGPHAWVSGCTATIDGVVQGNGDPYTQMKVALDIARKALAEAGFELADVVRTRWYVAHARDVDAVGRAHAEVFGECPPAATMLVVSALVDPGMLVEVELDAYRTVPAEPAGQAAPAE
ncbi:RidA family protein [Catenulispora yoronensis]|uniref:RidA family protein n=1 Tax=Catenulispora yoronensis TaxID=450799 RepID=A0ABN2UNV6_9ACTN